VWIVACSSAGFLSFDHCDRQAVDEQHDVRPALVPTVHHGELLTASQSLASGRS
jgi:hypothetical protein